jgi:hypothetical protein
MEARGSMALGIRRWLTRRWRTTLAAPLMAASVLSLSPIDQRKATLPGALSWSCGAPGRTAFSPSVTAGSTSYSTATWSAPSRAAKGVAPITTATAWPT